MVSAPGGDMTANTPELGTLGLPATVPAEKKEPPTIEEATGLVRLALEKEYPVDVLERLVALQERVTEREARREFFEALARFQANCPEIRKSRDATIITKSGGKYGYTFAPLEEITRAIAGPLQAEGLSYSWTTDGMDGAALKVVCVVRHIGGHEERAMFPVLLETAAAMSGAQKGGAALTYGKRQSLTSVLGLTAADEDTDGVEPMGAAKGEDTITPEQAADLAALIQEVGADKGRFLGWMGAATLEAIPAGDLDRGLRALEQRRAKP